MARNYKTLFHGDSLVPTFTGICVIWTMVMVILLGNVLEEPRKQRGFLLRNYKRGSKVSCIPTNIHLAPRSNVDGTTHHPTVNMTLSFTLPYECPPSIISTCVTYGRNDTTFQTAVPDETLQFTFANYIRSYPSSWIFHVILPDLIAGGQDYWYQITATKKQGSARTPSTTRPSWSSSILHLTTPPLPFESISIALIADWGGSPEALRVMQGMMHTNVSLVVIAGDISYANARLPAWEEWLTAMQPLFSQIPLIVAAGNHEIECNRQTFQVFQAYEHYFRNPNRIAYPQLDPIPSQWSDCTHPSEFWTKYWYGNSFYSYRHGLLQIIVLNSYTDTSPDSVQYQWLQQELEHRVNRTITPWLLVVFHCPLHTTFRGHNDEENPRRMMESMEPLFVHHQVNLVLAGHNHAYVRTYPMVGATTIDDRGPIYLTIGTGGDSHAQGPLRPHSNDTWVAHRDNTEYGFGQLQIVNTTHAYFQRVLNHHEENHPPAMDSVWIRNMLNVGQMEEELPDVPQPSELIS